MTLRHKRVLIVHGSLEVGGAETQSLHLAKFLREHGENHVEVWGLDTPGPLTERCEQLGIPWRTIGVRWAQGRMNRTRDLLQLTRALRRFRPDVLLPYTDLPNILCNVVSPLTGARVGVWNNRGADGVNRQSRLARRAMRTATCFIANSAHRRAHLIDVCGVAPDRVSVIRNGVALGAPARDRSQWRHELRLTPHRFAACMIANLTRFKDHRTLLEAWRIVVDHSPSPAPVLVLVGRLGDTADVLKALSFDLGLGQSVRFLGHVDDIPGLLGAMDLAVFSSQNEGLPNGVLEAMAAGLAVVASDDMGVREALGDEGLPVLSPPRHAGALAANVLGMIANSAERKRVGEMNRARITSEFSVATMCESTSRLLGSYLE